MTFTEAVATQPDIIRLWVLWMTVAMVVVPLVLLGWQETRMTGWVVLASTVAVMVLMQALFQLVGFTRLLGLAHVIVWGPLAIWLARRLGGIGARVPRVAIWVFLVTIGVSLVFDVMDVARYAAGDRASLVPAAER